MILFPIPFFGGGKPLADTRGKALFVALVVVPLVACMFVGVGLMAFGLIMATPGHPDYSSWMNLTVAAASLMICPLVLLVFMLVAHILWEETAALRKPPRSREAP